MFFSRCCEGAGDFPSKTGRLLWQGRGSSIPGCQDIMFAQKKSTFRKHYTGQEIRRKDFSVHKQEKGRKEGKHIDILKCLLKPRTGSLSRKEPHILTPLSRSRMCSTPCSRSRMFFTPWRRSRLILTPWSQSRMFLTPWSLSRLIFPMFTFAKGPTDQISSFSCRDANREWKFAINCLNQKSL